MPAACCLRAEVYASALGILCSRLGDSRLTYDEYRSVQEVDRQGACSTSTAVHPANAPRNRYINVLPYDHNRVTLKQHSGSDYINASAVAHSDKIGVSTTYIAAQVRREGMACMAARWPRPRSARRTYGGGGR